MEGLEGPLFVRIANRSNDSLLSIKGLEIRGYDYRQPERFVLDVAAGEMLSVGFDWNMSKIRILDSQKTRYNFFLSGRIERSRSGSRSLLCGPHSFFTLDEAGCHANMAINRWVHSSDITSVPGYIGLHFGGNVDVRTCDLADIGWDGPEFTQRWISSDGVGFEFGLPIEPREYKLHIPESCRLTSGTWMRGGDYVIDFKPPSLVSIPLQTNRVIPYGVSSVTLNFDEPIHNTSHDFDFDDPRVWGTLRSQTGEIDLSGPFELSFDARSVQLPIVCVACW